MTEQETAELVRRATAGDELAWRQLIDGFGPLLRHVSSFWATHVNDVLGHVQALLRDYENRTGGRTRTRRRVCLGDDALNKSRTLRIAVSGDSGDVPFPQGTVRRAQRHVCQAARVSRRGVHRGRGARGRPRHRLSEADRAPLSSGRPLSPARAAGGLPTERVLDDGQGRRLRERRPHGRSHEQFATARPETPDMGQT